MTIVMEEDAFSSSLSSLSTLSPQSNYQALIGVGRDSLNSSSNSSSSVQQQLQQQQQQISPNGNNSCNQDNSPFAVFIFRSNNNNNTSELFEERRISLDKPCKIGRSVAKIRPEPNNAIFDCKVLSRNHALLWEEKGKFYLQDTKSSNGTFLNGNRLGKSNEDSVPYELTSGDIIQFGVDVTENTKKVTHGCITVEVRLYHRPGVEAINKPNQQNNKVDVQTQELYQLALFLQEAMMREEILNQKLTSLQTFIDQAKETSENGWLTLIQEDRLLSRIDCLEKQTNLNNKNLNEEQYKKLINNLRDEKLKIENSAKETVQKMIEEKNELAQKLDELKSMHQTQEEECNQLQKLNEQLRTKILDLAGKNQELLNEIDTVQVDLSDLKSKYSEKTSNADADKFKYETQLNEFNQNEKKLTAQIELLMAEKDILSKQLQGLLIKLEQIKQHPPIKIEENEQIDFKQDQTEEQTDNNNSLKENSNDVVLNDLSNSLSNEHSETNNTSNKDLITISAKTNQTTHEHEKENFNISEMNVNSVINKESLLENLTNNSINSIQLNMELNKLNQEIENLKLKLENEMNTSSRLNNELNQFKALESVDSGCILNKNNNVDHINKINELEKQLEEKNELINQLTRSKNELINFNFKNIIIQSDENVNTIYSNSLEQLQSELESQENKTSYSNEYYNLKQEYNIFKNQIQFVEFAIKKLLEDRVFLANQNENILDEYCKYLQETCDKLKELKDKLENKINLNNAQIINDQQNNLNQIANLETRIKELEQICDEYKSKLDTSDVVIEDLNQGYDNLSLRAKIVSYFSMIPLCFLVFAILMAFYPTLSAITATGL